MKTRSDVVIEVNDFECVSLTKLIGAKVVDLVGEPDKEYGSFNVLGIILEDGRYVRIDSDMGDPYILNNDLISQDLIDETAVDYDNDDDDRDEWEDDADWDEDDDDYEEVDRIRL